MIARQLIRCGTLAAALTFGQAVTAAEKDKAEPTAGESERPGVENPVAWSEIVQGMQARIELRHSRVSNGTPIVATYLYLRNVHAGNNTLEVPWSRARMTFRLVDAAGNDLSIGMHGNGDYSGPGLLRVDLVLPDKGTLSFDISGQGLGIFADQVAAVDLGAEYCWILTKQDGACSLHAVLEIDDGKGKGPPLRTWQGRIELPPVPVPLAVEPPDPATADVLIRRLGFKMLKNNGYESREALRALSLIADARVIRWYVLAMETNSYELKYSALDRLSRFEGDEALAGLKKGMHTQGTEIGNCDTPALAAQMAGNVRHFAASALVRSPHPDAKRLLLTMWNDPAPGVRQTVVHALGKMDSEESLALLQRMSEDSDPNARCEAARYLKLRGAERAKPSDDTKQTDPAP